MYAEAHIHIRSGDGAHSDVVDAIIAALSAIISPDDRRPGRASPRSLRCARRPARKLASTESATLRAGIEADPGQRAEGIRPARRGSGRGARQADPILVPEGEAAKDWAVLHASCSGDGSARADPRHADHRARRRQRRRRRRACGRACSSAAARSSTCRRPCSPRPTARSAARPRSTHSARRI